MSMLDGTTNATPEQWLQWANTNGQGLATNASAWDRFSNMMGNAYHNTTNALADAGDGFFTQQGPNGPQAGWGMNAVNAGTGLLNSWLGFQQLGLAQDQFDFQKNAWQSQYNDQATLANAQMRDRQAARVASNPGAYQDVDSYMSQNKVGG